MGRKISAEEAAALGYKPSKRLSADEAAAAGYGAEDINALPAAPAESTTARDLIGPGSAANSAAEGFVQGGTLGFGDEIAGALGAGNEASKRLRQSVGIEAPTVTEGTNAINENPAIISKSWGKSSPQVAPYSPAEAGEQQSLGGVYRDIRDKARGEAKAAEKTNPAVYGGGELLGNLALPVPGVTGAKAATQGAKLATKLIPTVAKYATIGTATGAAMGAGKSEEDLTQGENVGAFLGDVGKSTGYGTVGGAIGGSIAYGGGKLANHFGNKAATQTAARISEDLAEEQGSTLGAMRQKTGEAYRTLEKLKADSVNPHLSPESRQAAADWLASEKGKQLAESVAGNTLEQAPGQFGELEAKRADFASAPDTAAAKSKEYLDQNTLMADVLPRALRYGQRAIPAAIGGAIGGPTGAMAGAVAGQAMGAPGTSMANLLQKTPRFAIQKNQFLANRAAGAADKLGKLGALEGAEQADKDKTFAPVKEQVGPGGSIEIGQEEPEERSKLGQFFGGQR